MFVLFSVFPHSAFRCFHFCKNSITIYTLILSTTVFSFIFLKVTSNILNYLYNSLILSQFSYHIHLYNFFWFFLSFVSVPHRSLKFHSSLFPLSIKLLLPITFAFILLYIFNHFHIFIHFCLFQHTSFQTSTNMLSLKLLIILPFASILLQIFHLFHISIFFCLFPHLASRTNTRPALHTCCQC